MDSRICLPSRNVVLSVKVPLGWLRRRSARFRPWVGWARRTDGIGGELPSCHGDGHPALPPEGYAYPLPIASGTEASLPQASPKSHTSSQGKRWEDRSQGRTCSCITT